MGELELKVAKEVKKEEVEELINEKKEVTNEKIEESLNYDLLSPEEKAAIDEFNQKLDIEDSAEVLQYGAKAQAKISEFSDSVLAGVKTKDTGAVGDLLSNLVVEIKSFDSEIADGNKKGIAKLFNNAKKQVEKIIAKYRKIEGNIESIEKELDKHKLQLLKDITILDTMYDKNLEYFKEISLYIIAGEKKLEELRNVTLPELKKKAEETQEQIDVQKVNDMQNIINRFEKKIYDLKTTRIISIQMAPQIRLLQNNDAELVDKIQSSLINTIPLWKNQIVIALGINNAKQALGAQKAVTDLTNDMLQKNSELLKQGSIEIAEESERAIVDIQTLQKTNKDIIETLDKVVEIHENGRKQRQEAEVELENIEKELKAKMLEIKVNKDGVN
ncbi:MAG: toxic anion resistance protein [Clostridia bacterium]|nr:toxic anion resistance protein [Clostridia bacterium]